jgi:hypothetical protein
MVTYEMPRTQLALDIGNRLFEDSLVLRYFEDSIYHVKKDLESFSSCRSDLTFYGLANGKQQVLLRINSDCGISKFDCRHLDFMARNGIKLKTDTLHQIFTEKVNSDLYSGKIIGIERVSYDLKQSFNP